MRLKSRGVTNLGTVEIRTDAGWVQVCDEDWDLQDALVVCREQNFNNGTALTGSKLGKVSTHDSMPNVAFRCANSAVLNFISLSASMNIHVSIIVRVVVIVIKFFFSVFQPVPL